MPNNIDYYLKTNQLILEDIKTAINTNDTKRLKNYLTIINKNIKKLNKTINQDELIYETMQKINKIITKIFIKTDIVIVDITACENLDNNINTNLVELYSEKQNLLELKKYLKDYHNLDTIFELLLLLIIIRNTRDKNLMIDVDTWTCKMQRINYIPSPNQTTDSTYIEETITKGLTKLKNK